MSICNTLDRLNRNFLWGHTEEKKKIHLVKWDTVCKPKCYGGLGLKKSSCVNQALLAKTGWRLLQKELGLWAEALNKKYLKDDCIMQKSTLPFSASSNTWKGILYGAQLLPNGVKWRIGPGTEISFWNDVWTDLGALSDIALKPIPSHLQSLRVCDVVCDGGWDLRMVKEFLPEDVKLKILSMHAGGIRSGDDTTIWKLSHNGKFTVKSAYHSLFLNSETKPWPWDFI
ncbi:PREDICTED: putative ribonuclease H protein At1g65750-like [Fragaria vesca subsp. vesca]